MQLHSGLNWPVLCSDTHGWLLCPSPARHAWRCSFCMSQGTVGYAVEPNSGFLCGWMPWLVPNMPSESTCLSSLTCLQVGSWKQFMEALRSHSFPVKDTPSCFYSNMFPDPHPRAIYSSLMWGLVWCVPAWCSLPYPHIFTKTNKK